jgi:hypothetical protein
MFEQDLEWIITGWDEGVGMGMEIFICFTANGKMLGHFQIFVLSLKFGTNNCFW